LVDIDSTLSMRKPELQVEIDRERAMDLAIPVQMVANTLNVLVGGQIVSSFKEGTEQYDVWLRADKKFRSDYEDLKSLAIPSPTVGQVPLTSLASLKEELGPSQIDRLNRQRTVTLMAHPDEVALNAAVQYANQCVADMKLPPEYQMAGSGQYFGCFASHDTLWTSVAAVVSDSARSLRDVWLVHVDWDCEEKWYFAS
jgi:HAE1 family hydrophobic/amphiphilic exporter-1